MGIFKAYDVRGLVPEELNADLAYRIGRALVAVQSAQTVVVGRDWRGSGTELAEAFLKGVCEAGANAVDIGACTTPMLYFAVGQLGHDAAAMVTASHNPPQYNGFKFTGKGASPVSYDTGLNKIEKLVCGKLPTKAASPGKLDSKNVRQGYLDYLLPWTDSISPLHVVVDAMHGSTGAFLKDLFDRLPVRVTIIRDNPEDAPPDHEANPLKAKYLEVLRQTVREQNAHLGMAFDGDGDRVMFVDERGDIVGSDLITALIAPEFLDRHPGSAIGYDLRSSRTVAEEIKNAGGRPVRTRVGHSFIKGVMREHEAPFAGELSGHFYFRDHFYAESADIAMLMVLRVLSRRNEPFSGVIHPLARYYQTGEVNFKVEDPDASIEQLAQTFADGRQDRLDGLTVDYDDWWFNVRKSNTEPILRMNLEAATPDLRKLHREQIERVITDGA